MISNGCWLDAATREKIVAVVDVKSGFAVHAIAGNRQAYQPIAIGGQTAGDPFTLVAHYRRRGIRSLYIADLDSIVLGQPQIELLERLIRAHSDLDEILIDIGLPELETVASWLEFVQKNRNVVVIVASECAPRAASLQHFKGSLDFSQVALGMDYRQGNFLGGDDSESDWMNHAQQLRIERVVALDVAAVGTSRGPSIAGTCSRIRRHLPDVKLYSGGGIRDDSDVKLLLDAGCDHCLVATALLDP
ncbi:hisA/hisF family protein [Rhodopirellula maiorica SM1]|uniref:HisA/hisF family protein n=1 Tax=Rhodopirellula maiorica SM1 TaxID=1265738 RepID=M5RYA6_9BACT|nr:HisA/HisF-related TIM barrel protein [Rhodopirellula maiorica]EMI18909.1 hisA/hisF family protein [Rhodopirellula maiorica SM1]